MLILLLFILASCSVNATTIVEQLRGAGFERRQLSLDNRWQVDVYAPHTLAYSQLTASGDLQVQFMHSMLRLPTIVHRLAGGVCAPYTVFRLNGSAAVFAASCGASGHRHARVIRGGRVVRWVRLVSNFSHVRYDFTRQQMYVLGRDQLHIYNTSTFRLHRRLPATNVTDFYIASGLLFYLLRDGRYMVSTAAEADDPQVESGAFLTWYHSGRIGVYYVPTDQCDAKVKTKDAQQAPTLLLMLGYILGALSCFAGGGAFIAIKQQHRRGDQYERIALRDVMGKLRPQYPKG